MADALKTPTHEERTIAAVEELRVVIKEYNLLNVDEQKAFRHTMYSKLGGFGTFIFKAADLPKAFKAVETKIAEKTDGKS